MLFLATQVAHNGLVSTQADAPLIGQVSGGGAVRLFDRVGQRLSDECRG